MRDKKILLPQRLIMKSLCGKSINNIHYLYSFYYCLIFPHRRHGIIIRALVVPRICCLYHLNIWINLLDPVRKIHTVLRITVGGNKGICPDVGRNVLDVCRDYCDKLLQVDTDMNFPPRHLKELPCIILVLLCLEFIIKLVESACPGLLFPNLDPLF